MEKFIKHKTTTILFLVLLMLTSQFPIGAESPKQEEMLEKNQLLQEILIEDEREIEYIEGTENARLTFTVKIGEDAWKKIQNSDKKLPINMEKDQKIYFDKHQYLSEEDNQYYLDFSEDLDNPEKLTITFEVENILKKDFIETFNFEESPIFALFEKDLKQYLKDINSEKENKVDEDFQETNQQPADKVEGQEDDDIAIDEEKEDALSDLKNEKDTDPKIKVNGSFYFEIEDALDYKVSYKGNSNVAKQGQITKTNPIKFEHYHNLKQEDLLLDIMNNGKNDITFTYKVKLDNKALEQITEETIQQGFNFVNEENGKQSPITIKSKVNGPLRFSQAFEDEMEIGSQITQEFGHSRLALDENKIPYYIFDENTEDIMDEELELEIREYKLQKKISIALNEFMEDELKNKKSVTEIKALLAKGISFEKDQFMIKDFRFALMSEAELSKMIDYPFAFNNFMGMKQDIKGNLSVLPLDGVTHTLTAAETLENEAHNENNDKDKDKNEVNGIKEIPGGFELTWLGVANTDRKQVLNNLSLSFTAPEIVTRTGINNWNIETDIEIEYDRVYNNGEEAFIDNQVVNIENTKNKEIIDLSVKENVGMHYKVTQRYIIDTLDEEIEGKQDFRITALVNGTNYRYSTISKVYPDAIQFWEIADQGKNPGTIGWSVQINKNNVSRKTGEGFILDIDKLFIVEENKKNKHELNLDDFVMTINDREAKEKDFNIELVDEQKLRVTAKKPFEKAQIFNITFNLKDKNEEIEKWMKGNTALKIVGDGTLYKIKSNGEEVKPNASGLTNPITASSLISLIDKKPLTIDYRTNEIIWGVKINTGSQYNLGLEGLTYYDKFSEGLKLSPFEEDAQKHNILLYRFADKASADDVGSFIEKINNIAKSNDLPNDQYNDYLAIVKEAKHVELINDNRILNLDKENGKGVTDKDFDVVFSQPKDVTNSFEHYPAIIKDASEKGNSKFEALKDKDFRLDFLASNNFPGTRDFNTYYLIYKTKVDSETHLGSVSNAGGLMYADYIPGEKNTYNWVGADKSVKKELGEIGQYNSLPYKKGRVEEVLIEVDENNNPIDLYDASKSLPEGHRIVKKLAVNWTIRFNHNVNVENDTGKKYEITAKIRDVIDQTGIAPENQLSNKNLKPLPEQTFQLKAFNVDKEGNLSSVDGFSQTVLKEDIQWHQDANQIAFEFKVDVNPQYVYSFDYYTIIEPETTILSQNEQDKTKASLDIKGEFENKVHYSAKVKGETKNETEHTVSAKAELGKRNKVIKSVLSHDNNRKVVWELELNDTYETMENLTITDTLIGKHTFKNRIDFEGVTNEKDPAHDKLDDFKIEIKNIQTGKYERFDDYTIKNLEGDEAGSLDNWITGESGFVIVFDRTIDAPIKIEYATYGQSVHKDEEIIINQAQIKYGKNDSIQHDYTVQAQYNFGIPSTGEHQYKDSYHDLTLNLKYDDNKIHKPEQITQGKNIALSDEEKIYAVLYRYASDANIEMNYMYRVGTFDEQGKITFKNLEEGRYIVKQLRAPKDYHIPDSLGFVLDDIDSNEDKSVALKNSNKNKLTYIDVNKNLSTKVKETITQEKHAVEAALFNLTPTIVLKNEGILKDKNGNVKENVIPETTFNLEHNDQHSALVTNDHGELTVGKNQDYQDITVHYDKPYRISQETKQDLAGYLINTERIEKTISKNKNGTLKHNSNKLTFNNYKVDVQIKNIDRLNKNNTLEGAEFKLYKANDKNEFVAYDKLASNEQVKNNHFKVKYKNTGLKLYNLEPGTYRLEQTKASDGYLRNPEALEFVAYSSEPHNQYAGKPSMMTLTFDNIKAKLSLTNILHKKAGTEIINDSRFAIFKEGNTSQIADYSLNGGGRINIAPGTYSLKQVETSFGRPLNLNEISFTIPEVESVFSEETDENTRTLTFDNHLGKVTIERINHLNESFQVESFELDGNPMIGKHEVNDLTKGEHKLENIKVEDQFIYIDTKPSFNIVDAYTELSELSETITLYATQAEFNFKNMDGDQTREIENSDAEFDLKHDTETITKTESEFHYTNLKPGNYILSQTKAPTLYGRNTFILDDINVPTEIDASKVTIDKAQGSISLYKLEDKTYPNYRGKVKFEKISGETNEALAGVEFNLYHNDQLIKDNLSTDDAGMIQLDLLSPGAYTFIETKSDENHLISKEKVAFEIADENENDYPVVDAGTLENHYAEVKFKNTNPNRDEIYKDAQFKLETFINNEWVTVENYENFGLNEDLDDKYFTLVGLGKGNYRLTQVQAPEKTILNEAFYEFTITDEYDKTIDKRPLIVLDDYINYKGSVMVDVIDPYGKVQLDISAHYSLVNETDKTDMTLVNGQLQAENLSPGKYRIYVESVDGAILVDETIDFEIVAQALNDEKTVRQNTLRVTYAYQDISLLDGKDETPLETGVWQLSQKDWQKDYQIDKKTITMRDLKPGSYSFVQSQAADDYILNSLNKGEFIIEKKLSDYDSISNNDAGYPIVRLEPRVFSNYKQNVIIEKTDEDGKALAQVGFSLNDSKTEYTNEAGVINYDQLSPGDYELIEVQPLNGYEPLEENIFFEIQAVQKGEPKDLKIQITNEKEVILPQEEPDAPMTQPDVEKPIIPALGMGNQSLYAALILIAVGVVVFIGNKSNKKE